MQGKGIVKVFLVLFTLVAAWQYFLNVPINKVENAADRYAMEKAEGITDEVDAYQTQKLARSNFLDSMSSETVFSVPLVSEYTYADLKKQQLAGGLDLVGGMSMVLEIDLDDFLNKLANETTESSFVEARQRAKARLASEQTDFITLFGQEYNKIGEPNGLARLFSRNASMRDDINVNSSNADVLVQIRALADETVNLTFQRLKERIGGLGVAQPNVTLDVNRDLILVELPGVDNPERAREYVQATAKLDFWETYRITDPGIQQLFLTADERLKNKNSLDGASTAEVQDSIWDYITDDLGNTIDSFKVAATDDLDPFSNQGPLLSLLKLNGIGNQLQYPQTVVGAARKNDRNQVMTLLKDSTLVNLFPRDMQLVWGNAPINDFETGEKTNDYMLYAIKAPRGLDKSRLTGELVVDATTQPDPTTGEIGVSLEMNQKGAKVWADMTKKAAQDNNREIAIMLDNKVVSAPRVNEPILGGNSSITGDFTVQEAGDLARFLKVGKLPAKTRIIQEATVGPSLGADNIKKSVKSLLVGFLLLLLFMPLYYGRAGIVSLVCLFANLFFIFGALASMGTVLTLPGIAGIILTIGMAVDANVIIFERVREELREGKTVVQAVADGFKHSYSAIIDANVTTILTAAVLAYFGLGPIKGFAVVLIIGVLSSLFTAVLLGRMIIEWWMERGGTMTFWTSWSKDLFANLSIDWIGKRKTAYIFSGLLIAAGVVSMFTKGFQLGVDFKGGYSYNIEFDRDVNANDLRETLTTAFGAGTVVKSVDAANTFNVTTSYGIDDTSEEAADNVMSALYNAVNGMVGGDLNELQFKSSDGIGTHVTSSAKVGPTIADDIKRSSRYTAGFALLLIFLYIFIRFNKWQYSLGAVLALAHDTLITLGLFSILGGILPFNLEIDQAFVAALLTIIGYSINDTVVVFDRIREFAGIYTNLSRKDIINKAVNSTISRTVITSFTTLLVVTILLVFGGSSIKGFAFALFIGILVGTYSSVFVATPVVYDTTDDDKIVEKRSTKESRARATV